MGTASKGAGAEELRRFAREHHVSYDLAAEPPAVKEPGESPFEVRLFATHGEDKLEAPMCPRCVELTAELRSFASGVVGSLDAAGWAEIMEPTPVLYAATDQRGPDEVSLTVRFLGERSNAPSTPSHVDRVKDGLKALGVSAR